MLRFLPFLTIFFLYTSLVFTQDLPKGLTEEEKKAYPDFILNYEYGDKGILPPDFPPRTPAEFEEAGGLIITWASYQNELREIVKQAKLRVPVYIVTSNPSNVQSFLTQGGISMDNITLLDLGFNSVWVRDFGPQSIYLKDTDELAFVDWIYNRPHRPLDNQIPANMANYLDIPIFQMTTNPNRLVATGGNFMSDGHGTGFSSKLILAENPNLTEAQVDEIKYRFMGIDRYIKMDELPYDNISHLDMHMKLLDEETLLVGDFPAGISDGPFIEANLDYVLSSYQTCFGRDYQVVRIPMVPSQSGNYPPSASYRTFTNSLILNDLVLIPTYHHSALNQEALEIYQQAMPGYQIMGVYMENVIGASGAIHCITREIAATDPIFISHARIREIEDMYDDYLVEATITNAHGITSASVFFKTAGQEGFTEITMQSEGDQYTAIIPAQACNATVKYFISASNEHKTITRPFPGATGPWSFDVGGVAVNFSADKTAANTFETIVFQYTGCLDPDDVSEVLWNFGEGANPSSSNTLESIEVQYDSPGSKTISLTIDGEEVLKENYILITEVTTHELTISTEGEGQTTPAPGTYSYEENEEVLLSAVAAEGWMFKQWKMDDDDIVYNDQEITVIMTRDVAAKAVFQQIDTGVASWQEKFLFELYPNPAPGKFSIVMTPSGGPVQIEIFNTTGSKVYESAVVAETWDQRFEIDLGEQISGIYFVLVSWNGGREMRKLILR